MDREHTERCETVFWVFFVRPKKESSFFETLTSYLNAVKTSWVCARRILGGGPKPASSGGDTINLNSVHYPKLLFSRKLSVRNVSSISMAFRSTMHQRRMNCRIYHNQLEVDVAAEMPFTKPPSISALQNLSQIYWVATQMCIQYG